MKQESLNRIWYGDESPGWLLGALERVYTRASASRRKKSADAAASDLEGRPIIVVGNITAGGTGKTPVVTRLCDLLVGAGISVAVISRGYGRKSRGGLLVKPGMKPVDTGDEPLLIAERCGVAVFVDENRENAARQAFETGAQVVIADDGLQRMSLPRSYEIVVIDGARGFGNGRLLPAGPLREPLERLESVDALICNGPPVAGDIPERCLSMELVPAAFVELGTGREVAPGLFASVLEDRQVHALAGIGNPERFFSALDEMGIKPDQEHEFTDHYTFERSDFEKMDGIRLMTEKDAVKCRSLGLQDAWYLRVDARLDEAWEQEFLGLVKSRLSGQASKP